jgi:hypothetical protein
MYTDGGRREMTERETRKGRDLTQRTKIEE